MRSLLTLVVAFSMLGSPALRAAAPDEVPIGGVLRPAMMRGLNGPGRNLSDFRGRPLLINVWASWCGPCRAEMASLERLAWRDGSAYFTIIGISTDDYVDNAEAALAGANATITHFIDQDLVLEKMLGASRLPLTVLIDADGRVLGRVYGAREWDGAAAVSFIDKTFGHEPGPASPAGP
jgi:thiol-disulfide isomerase/thioredoxin